MTRTSGITLVAVITVRRAELAAFHAFEAAAVRVMARHAGALARVVRIDDGAGETFREIHLVTFPDAAALAAYRADPALVPLAAQRARAIVATEVHEGVDGPIYGV